MTLWYQLVLLFQLSQRNWFNSISSELFHSTNFRPVGKIFNNLDSIQGLLKRISSMVIASMSNGSRINWIGLASKAALLFILYHSILFYTILFYFMHNFHFVRPKAMSLLADIGGSFKFKMAPWTVIPQLWLSLWQHRITGTRLWLVLYTNGWMDRQLT